MNKKCETHFRKIGTGRQDLSGPNLYEIEYIKSLKEELSIFLKSKHLNTIQEISIVFESPFYYGWIKVN